MFQMVQSYEGPTRGNDDSEFQGDTSTATALNTGVAEWRTDIRAKWVSDDDRLELGLFVNNLFDNRYDGGVGGLVADVFGVAQLTPSPPRFWGGDIKVRF